MRKHHVSFKHAWDGLLYSLKTQPNFWIHLLTASLVVVLGFYFQIKLWQWSLLVFAIVLVLLAEMINTSLESMVDLITQQPHPQAKIAKDVSAAMVLLAALSSVVIGLIVFLPYLLPILY